MVVVLFEVSDAHPMRRSRVGRALCAARARGPCTGCSTSRPLALHMHSSLVTAHPFTTAKPNRIHINRIQTCNFANLHLENSYQVLQLESTKHRSLQRVCGEQRPRNRCRQQNRLRKRHLQVPRLRVSTVPVDKMKSDITTEKAGNEEMPPKSEKSISNLMIL